MRRLRSSTFGSRLAIATVCLVAVGGCAVGPDFKPPEVQVPAAWAGPTGVSADRSAASTEQDLARWWTTFHPVLTSLVEDAVMANLNLKLAESRIRQARATRAVTAAGLSPTVGASGAAQGSGTGDRSGDSQYQIGFDASWEMDIFGGVRRGIEAADANVRSAVEDRRDVLVTLAAEVATNYVELRTYQQRIEIARKNLDLQKHSAELTRKKFEGGFVSALDVANADAQTATTTSQIPSLESSARQSIYTLSVLLGRDPGALVEKLSATGQVPATPPTIPVGLPSDLLRRRPDIRRAEADIHAATAKIGVATADLFPKVTLGASLGVQSDEPNALLSSASRFWSLGPSVSWTAFDGGRSLSQVEVQKLLAEQSVLTYRQVVLAALQETENALIASAKEQDRRKALEDAYASSGKAAELATKLYAEGQTDFLNVLSAQQSLYSSEDSLIQSSRTQAVQLIALYKALGGGWEGSARSVGTK